ncbi:hypothetical protein ACFQZO_06335 [Bradyrhizobium sp. GCM10027634]|uniref:hypothetical protein n=1 Tax=unclassified Bradyrhizobium TaxID=2631580 RepID=UPI00188D3420|nr:MULTISPECIES: hypothetical protein [unclassified Bradyrhizobium]MDN5000497.1 hypothetical protein [Bradyrhizobium sp. WYCCWR 12677]
MIRAIELFRMKADECEHRAKHTINKSEQAELVDMCAEFHWLSGEAARLQNRITQLDASRMSAIDGRITPASAAPQALIP